MKAAIITGFALILLAGCTSTPPPAPPPPPSQYSPRYGTNTPLTLSDAERAAVEAGTRAGLNNPPAATFRTMAATKSREGAVTVCGYVNTGSGDKPYVGTLSGGAFTMTGVGASDAEVISVQTACAQKGAHI